ncbi:MAG: class I mannose-6-phosphate isomerase [Erysipelotrichaceae bacterium]
MSNYIKFPATNMQELSNECFVGYDSIVNELKSKINKDNFVLTVDTYVGVNDDEIIKALNQLNPTLVINMLDIFKDEDVITEQMKYHLTDDRVFGKMYFGDIIDFIDLDRLSKAKEMVSNTNGLVIVYGFGASLLDSGDLSVYADMARWEIQMRYRQGMSNYKCSNGNEDILRKYKRGFFIEWRIADKHKLNLFDKIDYVLDTNKVNEPKMISGDAFRNGLNKTANQPFRTVPYFDPGVWGGQWMKDVCGLDKTKANFAWSFDGVPEENSLLLDFGKAVVEIPSIDLVLYRPFELLGKKTYARFGAEFPIRFDFLDTIGGQNLSLQVHPMLDYMRRQFGMAYTQEESYYILDAVDGAEVYLGLKENVGKDEMLADLRNANTGEITFDADKYINRFPAKKHDHFLIPPGTLHCSGSGAMVLEISATPYIFTFKLWDWGRLGLDGKPRPVHIDHGEKVIQWDRTTSWVKKNLVNAFETVHDGDDYFEEHTGLHELELIETRRFFSDKMVEHDTKGTVNQINLVEGSAALVESVDGSFAPFEVHYVETFIIPANVGKYTIKPLVDGEKIGYLKAYVRGTQF